MTIKAFRTFLGFVAAVGVGLSLIQSQPQAAADWAIVLALLVCSEVEHP